MRFILLFILGAISFSASAQWYRIDLKLKKHPARLAVERIADANDHSISHLPKATFSTVQINTTELDRTEYILEAEEYIMIKKVQHNMRFRVFTDASYNFSDLAHLYMQQGRFSEAKWFLLQSNNISRRQNDDKHTIANLIDLAIVKANMGDLTQAQQDLSEAHNIAGIKGFGEVLTEIADKMLDLKQNKLASSKPEPNYAETGESNDKVN